MAIIQTDKAFVVDPYTTLSIGNEVNPGYVFKGWNSAPDGSGIDVAANANYNPGQDITLYAKWEKIAKTVTVVVYSWNNDYSMTFVEQNGVQSSTTKQTNVLTFTTVGQTATLKVTSPGIMIETPDGETFNGSSTGWNSLNGSTSQRSIQFVVGEFTTLYVTKLPVQQTLELDGVYHSKTDNYGKGGTIFGGHKYKIHWYDDYTFFNTGSHTSIANNYTYKRTDQCFVNVAHKGYATAHTLYTWLGYVQSGQQYLPVEKISFQNSGMKRSPPNELANYYTDYFDEITVDLRSYAKSKVFYIGYSVSDNGAGCAGIKFRGKYRVFLDE